MKQTEVQQLKESIKNLKSITDSEQYLVSSTANKEYNKMMPILDKEQERLSNEKMEVNSPKVITARHDNLSALQEDMNNMLAQIVASDNKVIDYDIKPIVFFADNLSSTSYLGIIKYTS